MNYIKKYQSGGTIKQGKDFLTEEEFNSLPLYEGNSNKEVSTTELMKRAWNKLTNKEGRKKETERMINNQKFGLPTEA